MGTSTCAQAQAGGGRSAEWPQQLGVRPVGGSRAVVPLPETAVSENAFAECHDYTCT